MKRKTIFIVTIIILFITLLSLLGYYGFQHNQSSNMHKHTYETTYSSDALYHWFNASCEHEEEYKKERHIFGEDGLCIYCQHPDYSLGLSYTLTHEGYEYKGLGICTDKNVVIPSEYNNIPVVSVGKSSFENSDIISVVIPNTVIKIKEYAFSCCPNLSSVTLSDGLTIIGKFAFSGCGRLSNICLPDSLVKIEEGAFDGSNNLTSITLSSGLVEIGEHSFETCYKLVEVVNKSSLEIEVGSTSYGYIGFYAKQIITDEKDSKISLDHGFVIYDNDTLVAYVGDETEITIPNYVLHINSYALRYCHVSIINIQSSVISIGNYFVGFNNEAKVYYQDTMGNWNKIEKETYWYYDLYRNIIYCTDGNIHTSM